MKRYLPHSIGLAVMFATLAYGLTQRFWFNWVFWTMFVVSLGLGSLFIVAIGHLLGARWTIPMRRVPERTASLVLLAAALLIFGLFGLTSIYPWTQPAQDLSHIVADKTPWLNVPFFAIRTLLCIAAWVASYKMFTGLSLQQDASADPRLTLRMRRYAPAFLALFAVTLTVIAFDWISSLEPEWYSDIFGVYFFAGLFLAALAFTTLGVLRLKDQGRLPGVTGDHLHNLGVLMFAFTVFWSYIAFAQYMLIWYGNLPEEIVWYQQRIGGPWNAVVAILV
ncbi:MAG: quinol:cytochrome C oxidoreductase, partial [Elusimicrobiota bacterium]